MWFKKFFILGLLFFYQINIYALDAKQTDFHQEIYKNKLAISSTLSESDNFRSRKFYFYNNNALTYGLADIDTFNSFDNSTGFWDTIDNIFLTSLVNGKKGLLSAKYLENIFPDDSIIQKAVETFNNDIELLNPISSDKAPNYKNAVRTDMLISNAFGTNFSKKHPFHGVLFNRRATRNYNAPALMDDMTLYGSMFAMLLSIDKVNQSKVLTFIKKGINQDTYCAVIGAGTVLKVISETPGNIGTLVDGEKLLTWNQYKDLTLR